MKVVRTRTFQYIFYEFKYGRIYFFQVIIACSVWIVIVNSFKNLKKEINFLTKFIFALKNLG